MTQGAYLDVPSDPMGPVFRLLPVMAEMELQIDNYGVSGAFRVTDNCSVGAGLSYYEFELDSITARFNVSGPAFFAPPDYSPGNAQNLQLQFSDEEFGDDSDIAVNAGLQWKFLPKWSAGLAYRQGP